MLVYKIIQPYIRLHRVEALFLEFFLTLHELGIMQDFLSERRSAEVSKMAAAYV